MLQRIKDWELLEEKDVHTDYKGIIINVPENCQIIDIHYYDVGGLKETKMLHTIKFYKVNVESDEDYEKRKQDLKEIYHQEYLQKIAALDDK